MKNKSYEIGNHVFYVSVGLCEIIEKTNVDGQDYFVLTTLDKKNDTTIYVPTNNEEQLERICEIASKDILLHAIDNAKNGVIEWNENRRERQEQFLSILRSNDYIKILMMIKCLFTRSNILKVENKRLSTCDNDILMKAKFIIQQLVAYAFNVNHEDAESMLVHYFES